MSVRIGVLIPAPSRPLLFSDRDWSRLAGLGTVVSHDGDAQLAPEEAAALLADCDIGVGSWGTAGPCEALLRACPRLRLWEHVAGSVKAMFGPHLDGRELTIASCAPAIAEGVAEFVLGELIIGLRGVLQSAAANRQLGASARPARVLLPQATVGVIGASQVGRRVLRNLRPFGTRVLLYDPFLSAAEARELGVELVSDLLAICRQADAVTMHTPALPATRHLLAAEHFQAMRDTAVFINTSRGSCIDEAALIAELTRGRLFAFLDVSDPEPPAADSPLRRLANVVYTSHIAGGAGQHIGKQAVDDIAAFVGGRQPMMVVRPADLARLA